jgi:hypothetical protein
VVYVGAQSFNSTGGTIEASSTEPGRYIVRLNGILSPDGVPFDEGNVQVTAVNGNKRCRVGSWGAWAPPFDYTTSVVVRCHAPDGTPASSDFVMSYARFPGGTFPSSSGAYLLMDKPTGGWLDPEFQFGATSSVSRTGVGAYVVTLEGQAVQNGVFLVTAFGKSGAQYCKVNGWGAASATATYVNINCFAPGGTPSDSRFTLRYFRDTRDTETGSGGYAWVGADGSVSGYYQRNTFIDSFGTVTPGYIAGISVEPGVVNLEYGNLGAWGMPLVSAYSFVPWDASYCTVSGWNHHYIPGYVAAVNVTCWSPSGSLTDSFFDSVYLSRRDY